MGILNNMFKRNKREDRSQTGFTYGSFSFTSFFSDGGDVTEEDAMKIPAVSSAVELITASVAQLPIYLYKDNGNGRIEKIDDHRVYLLNDEPNELMNGYTFKKQIVKDYLFHGASYTKIEKVRNNIVALYILPITYVTVTKYIQGYKETATINLIYGDGVNNNYEFFPDELIIVLKDSKDGVTSRGILKNNNDILKLALAEQDYTKGILKNGALPIGVLKASSRLTQTAIDRLRASWENLYSGAKKSGKTIILEEGLDYQPISLKPDEMDLTNSRKNTVSEIARIFNVPESMLNSAANKYNSNEQNNLYFLQYCVAPIITAIEAALNKSLLLETEKEQGYYFRFDVSELLRTTEAEKINATVAAWKNGVISFNEARSRIDMPKLDDDYFMWSLGNIFYNPKTGKFTIPNTGSTIDPKTNNNQSVQDSLEQAISNNNQQNDDKPLNKDNALNNENVQT
jgi:HK97 family phage portal protein